MPVSDDQLIAEIMRQINDAKSVAPREIATALAGNAAWQTLLPRIKSAAIKLESAGTLVFIRKRAVVASSALRGVYRLASADQWLSAQAHDPLIEQHLE